MTGRLHDVDLEAHPTATLDPAEQNDDDDETIVLSWWQNPVNVVALVVAALLAGGIVGWAIARSSQDVADDRVSVGFLHDMRVHHEQAVGMSLIYLDRPDTEPGLRTVARTIVMGQSIDIGRMIQLLRDAGQPEVSPSDDAMAWMGMAMSPTDMPGLASEADLDELAAAEGEAADQLFARLMIAHHQGGVEMATYAAEHAGSDEVAAMAASMASAQRSEVAEIEGLVD